jgi:tRNA dimethylallyltransferase
VSPASPPSDQPGSAVRLLALAGPTAAGKTEAALRLARAFDAEIISVDSALVYRGMDIGTAKPTAAERALVPHHLIDIRDPTQPYSAAEFAADAARLVADINARGRLALLAGGTMLYFKALFEGLADMPAADPEVRDALNSEAAARGWPALHADLARLDPQAAARLAPNDAQRIQRALEIFRLSGQPMSALLARQADARTFTGAADARYRVIALEPSDRAVLHTRISERFDAMLAGGLIDEVQRLRARGDLHLGLPSMRCVGYRQVWEFLDGACDASTMRERGIAATRQLCKRQLTWLRSTPERVSVDCLAPDYVAQVARLAGMLE